MNDSQGVPVISQSVPESASARDLAKPFPRAAFALVAVLPFIILVPFANKAFTVDDTLFLWVAQQIQTAPLNFFGFDVNWYGTAQPMYEINKNPPGFFYVLAAFFAVFGWDEIPIHLAMAVLASLTAIGIYFVARRMTARPLLAALIAVLSPVFLLAANTIMTDLPMVLCYVWAVEFWMRGLDANRPRDLALSAVLIGVGALAKYFCISAIPLLAVYTLVRNPKQYPALGYLFIPVFILGVYIAYGIAAYGVNLLTSAADYAISYKESSQPVTILDRLIAGVLFLGGCLIPALFMLPLLWRKTGLLVWSVLSLALAALLVMRTRNADFAVYAELREQPAAALHGVLFFIAGAHILVLAAADFVKRRNAESLLLVCWLFGTFAFAALLNWTVNARTILPAAIPAAILIARRFETVRPWEGLGEKAAYAAPLALSALVSTAVLWGDYRWSNTQRQAAHYFGDQSRAYGREYLFKGHWGFQHYMEAEGLVAFDSLHPRVSYGDRIVVPENNYWRGPFNPNVALPVAGIGFDLPAAWGVSTMHRDAGAGWYSDVWGVLPYRIGRVPEEVYWVYQIGDYGARD